MKFYPKSYFKSIIDINIVAGAAEAEKPGTQGGNNEA